MGPTDYGLKPRGSQQVSQRELTWSGGKFFLTGEGYVKVRIEGGELVIGCTRISFSVLDKLHDIMEAGR